MYKRIKMEGNSLRYKHSPKDHNLNAEREIVPYLINKFNPASVVDVGCGLGTFLHVFQENGIKEIMGIDGSWVNKSDLYIPENRFYVQDLELNFSMDKKFDLVLCLEVAEHLSESSADILVDNLIRLGDIIVFSAAIINQGGQNHINEQPFDYWMIKFAKKGFRFYDVFREYFWNNSSINGWYKQNMFLIVPEKFDLGSYGFDIDTSKNIRQYVHPDIFNRIAKQKDSVQNKLNKIIEGKASGKTYLPLLKKVFLNKIYRRSK